MGSYTSPDSLYKPAVGEEDWGLAVDENFDTIQARLTALDSAVDALSDYDSLGSGVENGALDFAIANGVNTPLDFSTASALIDPQGWIDPAPAVSDNWNQTFPANSSWVLPPGLFYWTSYAQLTTAPADAARFVLFPDYLSAADAFVDSIDPLFAVPLYCMGQGQLPISIGAMISNAKATSQNLGMFRVPNTRADGVTPVTTARVGFLAGLSGDTQGRTVTYVNASIVKVR